ncbi:MAG TPA: TolC family protein [Vicinamibacteria bacterium]|nr:TolC family protein [Vicinamibacteria bacterium]
MSVVAVVVAGRIQAQEPPFPSPPDPLLEAPPAEDPPTAVSGEPGEGWPDGAVAIGLAGAVALALEGNFEVLSAADDVRAAELGYSARRADFFPKLTPTFDRFGDDTAFGAELGQRLPWSGGSLVGGAVLQSRPEEPIPLARSSVVSFELRQPLLRGFGPNRTYFELRNSRRSREGRARALERSRQRIAVEVTRAFYQVVEQRALLAVARQSLRRSQSLQSASEARLAVGLVSKLDVFRAQLQAAQAQESMVRAQASLDDALERFRFLLGRPPGDGLQPEAVSLPEELPADVEPVEVLVPRALANRLDLHESRDEVEDARRFSSVARQNLLPQLDLRVGWVGRGLGPSYGGAWRTADRQLTWGLETSFPLERSSDRADRALAEIQVATRERTLRQRELEIESEVRRAWRDLDQIRKSALLQKAAREVAEQQHRLATLRYQRGLASNFDVVEAEESLVLARSALVSLLARYQVERVDLLRTLGTLDVEREFAR